MQVKGSHQSGLSLSHVSPFSTINSHGWLNKTKTTLTFRVAAALHNATLRFQETLRPDPLFHDPYVACLVPSNTPMNVKQQVHPYCLATKFIDDKLLQTLKHNDELKQVVLLTDGADTRAYRLTWPSSTLIYDVSPERVYYEASQKLRDIGAQISRSCLLLHIPFESSNIQEVLRKKGFNGSRQSIWVLQGLPVMTLASFEDVLSTISSLASKESLLIGEVPAWLAETELEPKISQEEWMHRIFMRHGFQIQVIDYDYVATSLGRDLLRESSSSLLFVAEHLRFSDDQMNFWRREFQMTEEEADEDGFEDL